MLTEQQIIGFIEGTLGPEEHALVEGALTTEPTERKRALDQIRLDAALRAALGGTNASERVKQSVLAVIFGESEAALKQQVLEDTTFFTRRSRREQAHTSRPSSLIDLVSAAFRRPAWAFSFAALCLCLGLSLWLALRPTPAALALSLELPTRVELPTGAVVPKAGATLRVGESGSGTVTFADGTVLHLEPGTEFRFQPVARPLRKGGKQLKLLSGALSANVASQPRGLPLLIETPHAMLTVVGTEFDLAVSTNQTSLEVTEGLVKIARSGERQPVSVAAGQFAVAAPDATMRYGNLPRNPYLWPFSSESPWNTPIGSGAKYQPVPGRPFLAEGPLTRAVRGRPPLLGRPTDPLREVWVNGQVRGDVRLNESALPKATTRDSLVFLQRTRRYAYELREVTARPDGSLEAADAERTDLAGPGVHPRAVPALPFGLSSLGGLIRSGEYHHGIQHALSARVNRERLSGRRNFTTPGTVWPATGGDEPADKLLNVGTLLAIPPDVDIRTIIGESGPAFELARAMQDYGVYITGFIDAPFVLLAGEARLDQGEEDAMLIKLVPLLKVVPNNTAQTPGGGGSPRREPAPRFPLR